MSEAVFCFGKMKKNGALKHHLSGIDPKGAETLSFHLI
jgi:hypothetical protein